MKKLHFLLFIIFLAGCETYDIPGTYKVSVSAFYPEDIENGAPLRHTEITLRNQQTGREYVTTSDENGQATFDVRGGNYDILASFQEKHTITIDGYQVEKMLLFNGSLSGKLIDENNLHFQFQLEYSIKTEGFVIKEQYVSGSKTPEGENYSADLFVEIYNNSEETLFADGLCYGVVRYNRSYEPSPWVDSNNKMLDRLPLWGFVAIVPGSGNEHPVESGKSLVLALSGLNHSGDPNGNPNSIDLSNANWEMYVEDGKFVDVSAVPNLLMQRITPGVKTMIFNTKGTLSVLFRLQSNDYSSVFTDPENFMLEPGGSFNCFMVPFGWVIDGIENPEMTDSPIYKRLPNSIDAGYIQFSGGHSKVSIKRKVEKVVDGRTIYMDTNNSTNDFLTDQVPTPGVIASK